MQIGLVKKLALGFIAIVVVFTIAIGVAFLFATQSIVKTSYMEKSTLSAEFLVEQLDVKKVEALAKLPEENELYTELQQQLTHLLELNPLTYMYIVVPPVAGEEEAMTLVDGGDFSTGEVYALGETMEGVYYNTVIEELKAHGSFSEYEETEDFGNLITSYVPLTNEQGDIFAVFGVDDDFHLLGVIQERALKDSLPLFLGTIIVLSALIIAVVGFVIYRMFSPIVALRHATIAMDKGQLIEANKYVQQIDTTKKSAIVNFARAFRSTLQSFTKLIDNLNKFIRTLVSTSDEIQDVSHKVKESNILLKDSIRQINHHVRDQQQIAETANDNFVKMEKHIEHITERVHTVIDSLSTTTALIEQNADHAQNVSQKVTHMANAVEKTAVDVSQLATKYEAIEQMVNVIHEIAEQTNLLSLNASIEAARAGEAGKGFAIVAEEVKNLSDMTKGSAEHIRQHIEDFKAVTELVITQMVSSTADVQNGAKLVQNIHTELYKVLDASHQVKRQVDEVAATSTQIRDKADAVNCSIQQTSDITVQILHDAETVSETAQIQDEAVAGLTISVDEMAHVMDNVSKMLKKYEL